MIDDDRSIIEAGVDFGLTTRPIRTNNRTPRPHASACLCPVWTYGFKISGFVCQIRLEISLKFH